MHSLQQPHSQQHVMRLLDMLLTRPPFRIGLITDRLVRLAGLLLRRQLCQLLQLCPLLLPSADCCRGKCRDMLTPWVQRLLLQPALPLLLLPLVAESLQLLMRLRLQRLRYGLLMGLKLLLLLLVSCS